MLVSANAQWWNINNILGSGTTLSTTTTRDRATTTITPTTTTPIITNTTIVVDDTSTVPSDAPATDSTPNNSGTDASATGSTPNNSGTDASVTNSTPNNSGTSGLPSDAPATTPDHSGTPIVPSDGPTTRKPPTNNTTTMDTTTFSWMHNENGTDSWTTDWNDITTISISFPDFTTARPVSDMTICEKMRDDVLNSGIVGAWVPECSLEGEFTSRQCNYSARTCWCVGKDGEEFDDTRQFFQNPALIEDKKCPTQVELMTPCQRMREEVESSMMTGTWTPSCNEDGEFESLQCNMSARTCWCSDSEGNAIDNTHEFFEDPSGMYDKKCSAKPSGPCNRLQEKIDREGHVQGEYWPQCKDDGLFYPKQCVFKTRSCWCVAQDGERTSDEVFFDSLTRLKEYECQAPTSRPDISHNQEGLHFHGVNIMDMFKNILGQHLPEGLIPDGHKPGKAITRLRTVAEMSMPVFGSRF